MSSPLFSVIIPTYNRPHFLAQAVASVMNQTVQDFECIVIDDASPIPAMVPADPRFKVIRNADNRGGTAARNIGLRNASGRYICFLDDDDFYATDRLEMTLDPIQSHPITICWRALVDGSKPSSEH